MEVVTSRFGKLEVAPQEIFTFPAGLLGFENLKKYFFIDLPGNPAFRWLQSLEDPALAFLLADPFLFVPGYEVELDETTRKTMDIQNLEDVCIYTTVTIPLDGGVREATTNLLGPIVVNVRERRGVQLVLENSVLQPRYHTKHLLFSRLPALKAAGEC